MTKPSDGTAMTSLFERDEVREVLRDTFYRAEPSREAAPSTRKSSSAGRGASGRQGPESSPASEESPEGQTRRRRTRTAGHRRGKRRAAKPDHYEVICISMYTEDLARLDQRVAELKASGHRKMSRSALIRFALATLDTAELPRPL